MVRVIIFLLNFNLCLLWFIKPQKFKTFFEGVFCWG